MSPDDLLSGCLLELLRFGIAKIGPYVIDLEAIGIEWICAHARGLAFLVAKSAIGEGH